MVWLLKANYEWCFCRLNWNKLRGDDAITSETARERRINVFTRKQTPNNEPSNILKVLEVRRKVRLMFGRPKETTKGKCYFFSGYTQINKMWLLHLECKLWQDSHTLCTLELKCQKSVDRTYIERRKQETRYSWYF